VKSIYVYPADGGPARDFHGKECDANVMFGGVLLVVCSETEQHAWAPHAWHTYTVTEREDS
jgi:hypothetical protein